MTKPSGTTCLKLRTKLIPVITWTNQRPVYFMFSWTKLIETFRQVLLAEQIQPTQEARRNVPVTRMLIGFHGNVIFDRWVPLVLYAEEALYSERSFIIFLLVHKTESIERNEIINIGFTGTITNDQRL